MTASPSSAQRVIFVTFLFLFPLLCATYPINQQDSEESQSVVHNTQARAQVTWSGTQVLSTTYTVSVSDELVIQACTVVQMGGGVRIVVDGRLTVLGTQSCPVTLEASGLSDHEGIQFNSSSSGRGSIIQNLTIEDSIYGMTIYGSNPVIENLTVVNPDRVGVDMFNNAGPRITDLFIDQAGRSFAKGQLGDSEYVLFASYDPCANFYATTTSAVIIFGDVSDTATRKVRHKLGFLFSKERDAAIE